MTKSSAPIPASQVQSEAPDDAPLTEEQRLEELHKFPTGTKPSDAVTVPIRLLKLAKVNPRRGRVAEQMESLKEFGQHRAAVVQWSTGEMVIGNHMLKAAIQLGWTELDVLILDDDDPTALRRALADNFTGDKAGWDDEELADVLKAVGAVPGFSDSDVDALLAKLAPPEKIDDPTFPLVPRLNEKYDYVMIFCENETDWNWLQTKLELQREKSYKSDAIAVSHVVTVARFQELLGEGS
jgi:hypothetical protein